jgi:hypothetical protein
MYIADVGRWRKVISENVFLMRGEEHEKVTLGFIQFVVGQWNSRRRHNGTDLELRHRRGIPWHPHDGFYP